MAEVKWIKIATDIFEDEKIQLIESQPDGFLMVLVWIKILCLAAKCNQNGFLLVSPSVPFSEKNLSKIFKIKLKIISKSLRFFIDFGMMNFIDGVYVVNKWADYQSDDKFAEMQKKNRERQRAFKERQKQKLKEIKNNSNVTNNVENSVTNGENCSYILNSNNNITYIHEIIDYFNSKCGTKYTYKNKNYNSQINARLEEGFTVDDFKTVIDKKYDEWHNTESEKYLTPDTLFRPSKFEKYLNQKGEWNGRKRMETEHEESVDPGAAFDIRTLYRD